VQVQKKELRRYPQSFGFSLVELMIAVVILGIVMAVAIPNFIGLVDRNKVVEAGNRLTSHIKQARSEAVKRNSPVSLGSNTTKKWHYGWKIYAGDLTGADTVGAEDTLIRVAAASDDGVTIYGDSQAGMWLSFFANGMLNEDATATFVICNNDDVSSGRVMTVDRGGRSRLDDIPDGDDCTP